MQDHLKKGGPDYFFRLELATPKPGTSSTRMPAKLSVNQRASVTAGLANDVDDVNQ